MTFLNPDTWEALTAIGTVAMAVTTVVVIFQGRRLRKGDERRHQDEYRPLVILTPYDGIDPQYRRDSLLAIFSEGSLNSPFGTVEIKCALRNIGPGPALNLKIKFRFMDMNGYTTPIWELSSLRAGEQRNDENYPLRIPIQFLDRFNKTDFLQIVGKPWEIILVYEDIFGNSFHSLHRKNPLQLDRAFAEYGNSEIVAPQQPWVTLGKGKLV